MLVQTNRPIAIVDGEAEEFPSTPFVRVERQVDERFRRWRFRLPKGRRGEIPRAVQNRPESAEHVAQIELQSIGTAEVSSSARARLAALTPAWV